MMMSKYSKEKEILETEIRSLTRKQQEEMIKPNNELKAQALVEILKEFDDESILQPAIIQKLIKKIIVSSRPINNSNKNKEYTITILYFYCDEMIKEFKTNEE